jgi:O-acetyl-ADP-ribose deacetylase (regulator of RNase III)
MITYVRTNIFESNAQVLVNTVNTVGVMGKGLAKEFKRLYPDMFKIYQKFCEEGTLTVGKLQLYKTSNKWVLNFPTKANWRHPSRLEYIEQGLQKFVANYERLGIKSVSFPMLGCGNGGLDWESEVKPLMEKYLGELPIDIYIHIAKQDTYKPEHQNQSEIDTWLHSEPNYLSNVEFITDLKQRYAGLINTLEAYGLSMEISLETIADEEIFCIQNHEIKLCLDRIALTGIWHSLRENGILEANMLSSDLAEHARYVMVFLSELEYLQLTEIGDESPEMAVRLLSHKQPTKEQDRIFFGDVA